MGTPSCIENHHMSGGVEHLSSQLHQHQQQQQQQRQSRAVQGHF